MTYHGLLDAQQTPRRIEERIRSKIGVFPSRRNSGGITRTYSANQSLCVCRRNSTATARGIGMP